MTDPSGIDQLDDELRALGMEAMLFEEFDGFVAGLLVCPEMIPPSEWLPLVWGTDGGATPAFDDLDHANRVLRLVMEHYNLVASMLIRDPGAYAPLLPVDDRNGDIIWEIWIEGFETAVKLRPNAWKRMLDADDDTATAMAGMLALAAWAADDESVQPKPDDLNKMAPDVIAPWVVTLNAWRLANHGTLTGTAPTRRAWPKVGRNDPCPCGSGKKYKRCCGLH
jgi:uncharacterized protein